MTRSASAFLGFAAAAIAAGVANAALALAQGGYVDFPNLLAAFVGAFLFSLPPIFLLAAPTYLLLNRGGLVNAGTCLVSGAVVGALFSVTVRLPGSAETGDMLIGAGIGTVAALAFWVVWSTGRDQPG